MKQNILDLCDQRCPMSLLLAKRRCAQLQPNQSLQIVLNDPQARQDIMRYLQLHSFFVEQVHDDTVYRLHILKQGTELHA